MKFLTEEESNTVKLGIITLTFMLFLGFLLFFAAALTGCSSQSISANTAEDQEAEIFMLRCKVANQKAIIEAYEDVLHEVWLDKPAYVEDALAEGDAFIHLDEIMGENDVFRFHSKKDSIRYMNNWYGGERSW
jgi:hypothetical protein